MSGEDLTDEDPGAVPVLAVPGHGLLDAQVGLALVQLIDQLHLRQRTADTTEPPSRTQQPNWTN